MAEAHLGPAPRGREVRSRPGNSGATGVWTRAGDRRRAPGPHWASRLLASLLLPLLAAACGEAVGESAARTVASVASAPDTARVGVGAPLPGRVALPPLLPPPPPPRVIPEPPALTGDSPPPALETTELPAPVFQRPEHIRGIYLNAWVSGSRARREELIELARRTEVNTFVIDVKDESGYLSYGSRVELAREIGADRERRIRGIRELLHRLNEEGIYPVARIVIFKDPLLALTRPDLAVQHMDGKPWVDGKGDLWVNPWAEEVWDYHIELAREAVELGFPEIQWDYIRFPDRPAEEMAQAVFPGSDGRPRTAAVRGFLQKARADLADLGVPLTADVFGLATSFRSDVGIGQVWEEVIDVSDAVLPMIYPSHYWRGSFGFEEPNDRPYEVVAAALRDAVRRTEGIEGSGRIIPWLQNFTLGPPAYGAPEVRAQILATYDQGIQEWILWNASGRYTEEALEPVAGWPDGREPMIRIAGQVMDAEWRFLPLPAPIPALDLADDLLDAPGSPSRGQEGVREEDRGEDPGAGDPDGIEPGAGSGDPDGTRQGDRDREPGVSPLPPS